MADFDRCGYPEGLSWWITDADSLPLDAGVPNREAAAALAALDLDAAFSPRKIADRAMARACHSGLWLLHNFLDESHKISQEIETPTGSFWHGIMHRREGDFSNTKYWFRRVGDHPVYAALAAAAHDIAPDEFFKAADWDPFDFVDRCESAVRGRSPSAEMLGRIGRREWELLFDFCYKMAANA
jgi:hypothetical protein